MVKVLRYSLLFHTMLSCYPNLTHVNLVARNYRKFHSKHSLAEVQLNLRNMRLELSVVVQLCGEGGVGVAFSALGAKDFHEHEPERAPFLEVLATGKKGHQVRHRHCDLLVGRRRRSLQRVQPLQVHRVPLLECLVLFGKVLGETTPEHL